MESAQTLNAPELFSLVVVKGPYYAFLVVSVSLSTCMYGVLEYQRIFLYSTLVIRLAS